ncbi:hypothetical protein [Aeromicrobium terrae]|jgi:hypothetical protein|uniref:Lipoprotein n=1 Tax=Aeromicrobium terrae TaxID=2498846 RepID=A0A5C8NEX0_9ACTN|nr:hypothetical protein [Aeromicrobium terrae]TXL57355.1 hypothetical protein FHP06_15065 [Aeromicrobium terrae]
MKVRVLVAAVAALLLTGCGSVHPGAAAVVDDDVISMHDADDTAQVYCSLTLLQGTQGQERTNADIRRDAVRDLVLGVVARRMAEQDDIDVSPSTYEVTPAQRRELAKAFSADDLSSAIDAIEHTQQTYAIVQALGKRSKNIPATDDPNAVLDAGLKLVQAEMKQHDISYDPRFGLTAAGDPKSDPTPLSVSPTALDASMKGLPATQRCA